MKQILLSAAVLFASFGTAHAFEPASQAALMEATEDIQAGLDTDLRPTDTSEPPTAQPAAVEPAAGAEPETTGSPAERDTTRELQQQMKLPRKH